METDKWQVRLIRYAFYILLLNSLIIGHIIFFDSILRLALFIVVFYAIGITIPIRLYWPIRHEIFIQGLLDPSISFSGAIQAILIGVIGEIVILFLSNLFPNSGLYSSMSFFWHSGVGVFLLIPACAYTGNIFTVLIFKLLGFNLHN